MSNIANRAAAVTTALIGIEGRCSPSDALATVSEDFAFLGGAGDGWNCPGAPPETKGRALDDDDRAAAQGLQAALMTLRAAARAESTEVLETEGWGNSEWALMRLARLTGLPWHPSDQPSSADIVRGATETLARPSLDAEEHAQIFSSDGDYGYNVLFDAYEDVLRSDGDALALLEPLLDAIIVRRERRATDGKALHRTWTESDLFENLRDDLRELRR